MTELIANFEEDFTVRWYSNLSIALKQMIGFLIVALIGVIIGIIGLVNINKMIAMDERLYAENTLGVRYASDAHAYYQRTRYNIVVAIDRQQDIDTNLEKISTFSAEFEEKLKGYEATIKGEEGKEQYNQIASLWTSYKAYIDQVVKYLEAGEFERAGDLFYNEAAQVGSSIQELFIQLNEYNAQKALERANGNKQIARTASMTMVIVIIAGLVISLILGLLISRTITNPIKKVAKAADTIANRDLNVTVDIDSKDETGQLAKAFTRMAENMNEVMLNINNAAYQVSAGAKQVSDSSITLSQGAAEQASSVEELTTALGQIAEQTKMNAESADHSNELAKNVQSSALLGNSQMKEMLRAMDDINISSSNIAKIIKVIDEIAFQTNILALNAAVEAARAGQHGKGFAVVAEEVRNLAARSANAAKETTDLIENSIKKAEDGTKIANETAKSLEEIIDGIEKVANIISDIAKASSEQAAGIEQINQGIIQVSKVVQNNSATSEESATASEELANQAQMLREIVSKFKFKKNGQTYYNYDEISSSVFNRLDRMSKDQRQNVNDQSGGSEEISSPVEITLMDQTYGKY